MGPWVARSFHGTSHTAWQSWETLNSHLPVPIQPCGILVLIAAMQELNGVTQVTVLIVFLSLSDLFPLV